MRCSPLFCLGLAVAAFDLAGCGATVAAGASGGKDSGCGSDTAAVCDVLSYSDALTDASEPADTCSNCDVGAEVSADSAAKDAAVQGDVGCAADICASKDFAVSDTEPDTLDAFDYDFGGVDSSKVDAPTQDIAGDAEPADVKAKDSTAAEVVTWPDGKCAAEQDCKNAQMCFAPGESMGCGMCFNVPDPCQSDAACGKGQICQPTPCACGGESSCQAGCALPSDCKEGTFCAPDGNCVADVCKIVDPPGKDPSCKPNFVCLNAANPHCQRKTCATSADCQGACVKGLCYSEPGFCSYPPP